MLTLFWILAIPAILAGGASLLSGRRQLRAISAGMKTGPHHWTPPVTLIVPVRGLDKGLVENIQSLLEQDHPDFEVLIATRSAEDPAVEAVRSLLGDKARLVIAAPGRPDTGEKINNLLAAVAQARTSSEVLVFADSDGRVGPRWLRALVAPLRDPATGASTGYRWYFPEDAGFWSLIRSVWNSTIAGTFGAGRPSFAWGGAMAIRRQIFHSARVADFWQGAVSDDYRLTQAVRAAGLEVRFTPQAMVETSGECSAGEFLRWAVRQMIITKVYAPRLWWPGLVAHIVYCGAITAGLFVAAGGRLWALPILLLTFVPGMWRGELRRRVARLMFPDRAQWLDRHGWAYSWLALPATWIWLYVFLASAFTRRIEWRGNRYELLGPDRTKAY